MKIFIKKFKDEELYGFTSEADRNESSPHEGEEMAGVSARKVKEWKKIFNDFIKVQEELTKLYENTANQS